MAERPARPDPAEPATSAFSALTRNVRHSWPFWYPNPHLYAHRMALYHIRQIGLDGHDLTAMVDFWSAALGYELDHRESGYAILRDPADAEPRLFLQQVPEPKVGKNRAHMDVEVPDEGSAVDRLLQLGARVLWREDFHTHHWTVLADPEGNEFCVGHFG